MFFLKIRYPLNTAVRNSLGEKTFRTEDEETFKLVASAYADKHPLMAGVGCGDPEVTGALHGAQVQEVRGSLMDYLYYSHSVFMVSGMMRG